MVIDLYANTNILLIWHPLYIRPSVRPYWMYLLFSFSKLSQLGKMKASYVSDSTISSICPRYKPHRLRIVTTLYCMWNTHNQLYVRLCVYDLLWLWRTYKGHIVKISLVESNANTSTFRSFKLLVWRVTQHIN